LERKHTILAVDDEENILRALKRVFRRDGYQVITATSGQQGLSLLSEHRVSLIISDQRMPGMIGAEFLARAKGVQPHALRIMLTGHPDLAAATQAINEGEIWRYLTKPWDDEQLRLTVREALEHHDLAAANRRLTAQLKLKNRQLEELNASLEEKVRQRTHELALRVRELEAHDRITQLMLTVHSLDETADALLDVVADVLEMDHTILHLLEDGELVPAAGRGAPERGMRSGRATLSKLPVTGDLARALAAAAEEVEPIRRDQPGDPGVSPFALVPVRRGDELLAVIEVAHRAEARPVDDDEIAILTNLSVQAAVALHDARTQGDFGEWKGQLDSIINSVDQLDDLLDD